MRDGDTVDVEFDLGFRVRMCHGVRVWGVETPELTGTDKFLGQSARAWVRDWVGESGLVWVTVVSWDRYGRVVGHVRRQADMHDLRRDLIDSGIGWERGPRGRRPDRPSGGEGVQGEGPRPPAAARGGP